tara:strand:+ start:480 stop:596 length:117 start_codon:yes stop_codon:yes gene_type:complete
VVGNLPKVDNAEAIFWARKSILSVWCQVAEVKKLECTK